MSAKDRFGLILQAWTRRTFMARVGAGVAAMSVGCSPEKTGEGGSSDETGSPGEDDTSSDTGGDSATDTAAGSDTGVDTGPGVDTASPCKLTPDNPEGPFYLGGAPERSELDVYGHEGVSLTITGQVTDSECNPRPFVILDLWHSDPDGDYDMESHDLRYSALVPTDAEGRFSVHTLYPVAYGDGEGGTRASHVHLKVWVDGEVVLTSQWYFEGDPNLNKDSTSKEGLIISLEESADGALSGVFDFVV